MPAEASVSLTILTSVRHRDSSGLRIAKDLVTHCVGRGFSGKAMYVGLDKAAAVRMYNLAQDVWAEHLVDLKARHDALPELERP